MIALKLITKLEMHHLRVFNVHTFLGYDTLRTIEATVEVKDEEFCTLSFQEIEFKLVGISINKVPITSYSGGLSQL